MSRLLLVDDDPIIADTILEILRAHSLPGVSAGSGEEALEKLSAEPFDLVLLDARLPGMSGFEACQRIRERFGASLPVIILTAFGDERMVRQGFEAGADDFCTKPLDTPVF